MKAPDYLAPTIAKCLSTVQKLGDGKWLQLTGTPAADGFTVTLEVHPIGFGTIGEETSTYLLRIESPPTPHTNGAVDPVTAGGAA